MCGILGIIGDSRPSSDLLVKALDTLAHRGPDDFGTYEAAGVWLGHRRLSIIDLSSAGHQPMIEPTTGCTITYNGEIYNYIELRRELELLNHTFQSSSDTEVLLKAYLQWGEDCVSHFNGMWAFSIWDPRTRTAFLARDRFGVKPLYYRTVSGAVQFASEPKALNALSGTGARICKRALYRFVAYGELYTENQSFYDGILLLPPGHVAIVRADNPQPILRRFWSLENCGKYQHTREEFDALFESAVAIRLRSDVPVGLSLSGGVDSSAILAPMARQLGDRLTAFTSVYGTNARSEFGWATMAAARTRTRLDAVMATKEQWLTTIDKICWHMDAPGYSPAVFPTWQIMHAARSAGIPVMLEGQGADEAFAGYPQYAALKILDLLTHGAPLAALRLHRSLTHTFSAKSLLLWEMREAMPRLFRVYQRQTRGRMLLQKSRFSDADSGVPSTPANHPYLSTLGNRLRYDFEAGILPGLLHYGDAMSMAHSVESRQPFLDYRLVEWIMTAPDEMKIGDGETKPVLRQYLRKMGLSLVADRRDKLGYPTPVLDWLLEDSGKLARELLLAPESKSLDLFDRKHVEIIISRHVTTPTVRDDNLYKLVSAEIWMRKCID